MSRPRGGRRHHAPAIDIVVESRRWKAKRGVGIAAPGDRSSGRAVSTSGGELAIVLTDDLAIRTLNRTWRGKDEPTNVLSFPAIAPPAGLARAASWATIVIAYETLTREAAAERKPFAHHLAHLAVHGYLHLARPRSRE